MQFHTVYQGSGIRSIMQQSTSRQGMTKPARSIPSRRPVYPMCRFRWLSSHFSSLTAYWKDCFPLSHASPRKDSQMNQECFFFSGGSIKNLPATENALSLSAQGEQNCPRFHLNSGLRPHSLPVTWARPAEHFRSAAPRRLPRRRPEDLHRPSPLCVLVCGYCSFSSLVLLFFYFITFSRFCQGKIPPYRRRFLT